MIKRIDPKATFKLVSRFDDALELETKEDNGTTQELPAGHDKYIETFDTSSLKFKEGSKPTYFVTRCLRNDELIELNEAHFEIDLEKKRHSYKNTSKMYSDVFKRCVSGIEEDGKLTKVTELEIEYKVVNEIGSMIFLMSSLGKNLKKE